MGLRRKDKRVSIAKLDAMVDKLVPDHFASNNQLFEHIGSGLSSYNSWEKRGDAPLSIEYALLGVAYQHGAMNGAAAGVTIPEAVARSLLSNLIEGTAARKQDIKTLFEATME